MPGQVVVNGGALVGSTNRLKTLSILSIYIKFVRIGLAVCSLKMDDSEVRGVRTGVPLRFEPAASNIICYAFVAEAQHARPKSPIPCIVSEQRINSPLI